MSRMSVFNSPFLLGFEQFERTIDRISKLSTETYPPYNIEQISSNLLRITIAVAGFEKEDLEINLEGNQLQIKGFKKDENDERIFLHRGIATRQFQRNFVLAEGIEVEGASMENGLLSVDLSQPINSEESKKIDHASAVKKFDFLEKIFPNKVSLLHGKIDINDKERILTKFLNNEFKILVSTTVIEVGIDFPNANVIIIENSNKFGLSQLHQLREPRFSGSGLRSVGEGYPRGLRLQGDLCGERANVEVRRFVNFANLLLEGRARLLHLDWHVGMLAS